MRNDLEIISKNSSREAASDKEVTIRISKSGLSASKKQRFRVAIRLTIQAAKKVSKSGYVIMGISESTSRMYFLTGTFEKGFKLSESSKETRCISFCPTDLDRWRGYVGEYDLHKDVTDGSYYIDLPVNRKE